MLAIYGLNFFEKIDYASFGRPYSQTEYPFRLRSTFGEHHSHLNIGVIRGHVPVVSDAYTSTMSVVWPGCV